MNYSVAEHNQCPYCHQLGCISQIAEFRLPRREVFTNRRALLHLCDQCEQIYMSVIEQSEVSSDHDEFWNDYHYYLPKELQADFLISASLCGSPRNPLCPCTVHELINEIDFSKLERLGKL